MPVPAVRLITEREYAPPPPPPPPSFALPRVPPPPPPTTWMVAEVQSPGTYHVPAPTVVRTMTGTMHHPALRQVSVAWVSKAASLKNDTAICWNS